MQILSLVLIKTDTRVLSGQQTNHTW